MLEIRLEEHSHFVDQFVITEANQTFSGHPKPLYFDKERFSKFNIIYNVIDLIDTIPSPRTHPDTLAWRRDCYQRNYPMSILSTMDLKDDDIIINTDLDEIVNANKFFDIKYYCEQYNRIKLQMPLYNIKLNYLAKPTTSWATMALWGSIKNDNLNIVRNTMGYVYKNAGWHFSFLSKDNNNISYKLQSFAHCDECTIDFEPDKAYKRVMTMFDKTVYIDETFPEYVVNNIKKFKDYIGD